MQLNANFAERVVVHGARLPWVPSPMAGVERKMLDRLGGEVARATSIVRYAPGSTFAAHTHHGGEEFLVLEGMFQDEHGDYPAGTYVRNPPTSAHTPGSRAGCTIFVKLWQFDLADRTQVRIEREGSAFAPTDWPGVESLPLFADAIESVRLERWAPHARVELALPQGGELLVLSGALDEGGDHLEPLAWLRIPPQGTLRAAAGAQGCTLWCKSGHLVDRVNAPSGAAPGP